MPIRASHLVKVIENIRLLIPMLACMEFEYETLYGHCNKVGIYVVLRPIWSDMIIWCSAVYTLE